MTIEGDRYTREAAEKLEYDWAVVKFFLANNSNGLIDRMWDKAFSKFTRMLKNEMTKKDIEEYMNSITALINPTGDISMAHEIMLAFLNSQENPEEQ